MSENRKHLEKRLVEYVVKAEQLKNSGDYFEAYKWEFEADTVRKMIKVLEEQEA